MAISISSSLSSIQASIPPVIETQESGIRRYLSDLLEGKDGTPPASFDAKIGEAFSKDGESQQVLSLFSDCDLSFVFCTTEEEKNSASIDTYRALLTHPHASYLMKLLMERISTEKALELFTVLEWSDADFIALLRALPKSTDGGFRDYIGLHFSAMGPFIEKLKQFPMRLEALKALFQDIGQWFPHCPYVVEIPRPGAPYSKFEEVLEQLVHSSSLLDALELTLRERLEIFYLFTGTTPSLSIDELMLKLSSDSSDEEWVEALVSIGDGIWPRCGSIQNGQPLGKKQILFLIPMLLLLKKLERENEGIKVAVFDFMIRPFERSNLGYCIYFEYPRYLERLVFDCFEEFGFLKEESKFHMVKLLVFSSVCLEDKDFLFKIFNGIKNDSFYDAAIRLLAKISPYTLASEWERLNLGRFDEQTRVEMILIGMKSKEFGFNWSHTQQYFKAFGITSDQNKAQILSELLIDPSNAIQFTDLEWLEFSSPEIGLSVLEQGIETLDPNSKGIWSRAALIKSENSKLVELGLRNLARLEFPAPDVLFEKMCIDLVKYIPQEFDRLRVLKFLGELLINNVITKYGPVFNAYNEDVLKKIASMMWMRHPQLRSKVFSFWNKHFLSISAVDLKRNQSKRQQIFHSQFLQPVSRLLKQSSSPQSAQELLEFLKSQRKTPESVRELPEQILASFSDEEKRSIQRIWTSYQTYQRLHSPEKFESQLLAPMVKVVTQHCKKEKERFVRELCGQLSNPAQFELWLQEFSLPVGVREHLIGLFAAYQDTPKKYDFNWIEMAFDKVTQQLTYALLRNHPQEEVTRLVAPLRSLKEGMKSHFNLHYFSCLETLLILIQRMNSGNNRPNLFNDPLFILSIIKKLDLLIRNSDGTPFSLKEAQSVFKTIEKELSSLCTLLQFAENDGMIKQEEWDAASTFSGIVQHVLSSLFEIPTDPESIDQFLKTFFHPRLNGLFGAYVANLRVSETVAGIEALKAIVQSVLKGTFEEDRLRAERSPTMQRLQEQEPEVYQAWKALTYSRSFYIQDGKKAEPFDPLFWLHQKIVIDQHLNPREFPNLLVVLEGGEGNQSIGQPTSSSGQPASSSIASSSAPSLEQQLICCTQALSKEEQISSLQSLLEFPLNDEFKNDVIGALALLNSSVSQGVQWRSFLSNSILNILGCGTYVLGSCQHLSLGDPTLMGYCDGKFRPLLNQDHQDTPSTRAFLKIDFNAETRRPLLFLERFYTRLQNPQFFSETERSAIEIARQINSQLPEDKQISLITKVPPYSDHKSYKGRILSLKTFWGPKEYSDAAAGAGAGRKEADYSYASDLRGDLGYLYHPDLPSNP